MSLDSNLNEYISGIKKVPIITYFIDSSEISPVLAKMYPDGA